MTSIDPKEEIIKVLEEKTGIKGISLEVPKDKSHGDYAFPCFQASKQLKKNPVEISFELSGSIKPEGIIKEISSAGPYLNFTIDKQKLASSLIPEILSEDYGKKESKNKKVMVEFLSPNTNKSLHLGHVRNGVLGESVSNILKNAGYGVIKTSLNNDRGTGIAEAMLGYMKFFKNQEPKGKPDHFVAECYVEMKKAMKEDESLKEEVQDLLLRWEQGDEETIRLWKKMMSWVYDGYKKTYENLGISFDKEYYESEIYKQGKEIVQRGLEKGVFEKQDGAVIAKLEEYGLPNKVLIKSDGTSLYMTQDIYLAKLKYEEFKMDHSLYVVASEQDNHFHQLFRILKLLDFNFADSCYHLSYGMVNLPSGRMKSREGNIVDADDLVSEVIGGAKKEIQKRHPELPAKDTDYRAEIIGLGALKFFMLKYDNVTSFVFDPEESLSFEGETGPYVQYAHARICSILDRYGKDVPEAENLNALSCAEDENLVIHLFSFPSVLDASAESYKPHLVARYLIELAQKFNEFYHSCPILQADQDTKIARLNLILAVKKVLSQGLELLGIHAPDAM